MNTPLTEDDTLLLSRVTIGRQPFADWLASNPPPDKVRAMLVKFMDKGGPRTVFARLLSERLGVDPVQIFTENWPRKAARLAADARSRGDDPHADSLHAALVALMFCANCGRSLGDPVSVERGIGPDCWEVIESQWRDAILERLALPEPTGALW